MELLLNSTVALSYTNTRVSNNSRSLLLTNCSYKSRISLKVSQRGVPLRFICRAINTPVRDTSGNGVRLIDKESGFEGKRGEDYKDYGFVKVLARKGVLLAAVVCGFFVFKCRRVMAMEGVVNAGEGIVGQCALLFRNAWPKMSQVLLVFKEQGLILAALLSLSAFFSMAETSITTLWPWKVRELAEKEPDNGVFRMLKSDVTRFLTTILIGTTYFP